MRILPTKTTGVNHKPWFTGLRNKTRFYPFWEILVLSDPITRMIIIPGYRKNEENG